MKMKTTIAAASLGLVVASGGVLAGSHGMGAAKTLAIGDQTITYYESTGTGPTVFFIHGNSASALTFDKQINGALGEQFRIIAIDLPGHGGSTLNSDMEQYSLPGYAAVVVEAANALNAQDAVFVGWSLGGHIALEALPQLTEAKGVLIYGTPPLAFPPDMEGAFLPHETAGIGFTAELSEEQANAFAQAFFVDGAPMADPRFAQSIMATDPNARSGLAASIKPDGYADEVAIVANAQVPIAVLHGAGEQLVNGAYFASLDMPSLWRGEVQMVEGAGHAIHWEQAQAFDALVAEFVGDVNQN